MMESEEVGDIFRGGRAYDVHVWSTPETRHSMTSLLNLPLDTPSGGRVALRNVANVRIVPSPNVIHHEGASRSIDVDAGVTGTRPRRRRERRQGSAREAQAARSATTRSCSASTRSARTRRTTCSSTASPRRSGSSSCCRPRSAAGGSRSCRSSRCRWRSSAACSPSCSGADGILSIGSLVGFFTVFGIAARNGILMINHFQHLERFEGETFGPELVMRGALERLSPILMTTLATGLALVPLVVAGNSPGPRDRAPAGRRDRRRPHHVDAAQPVRRAGPLPPLRKGDQCSSR